MKDSHPLTSDLRPLTSDSRSPTSGPGLLDLPVLLAGCGGDAGLLKKMCQTLQARVPERLATLRAALRDRDAPGLRETAHKFCGLLSEFSTVAGDQAGSLEDIAARASLDEALPLLEELETMANELVRLAGELSLDALLDHVRESDKLAMVRSARANQRVKTPHQTSG